MKLIELCQYTLKRSLTDEELQNEKTKTAEDLVEC